MQETRYLYIMLSQTDTVVGRVIRSVSQYPYNHVSLTLDASLRQWYSFARYVQDAPFFGGFVREPVERFLAKTGDVQVRIFRLAIPMHRARMLEQYLATAGQSRYKLLYNYYDALACGMGFRMELPDAHTCLSFACTALDRPYRSIEALGNALEDCKIYQGSLASLVGDSGCREDIYFSRMGLIRGTAVSAVQLGLLSCRLICQGFDSHTARRFHRSAY